MKLSELMRPSATLASVTGVEGSAPTPAECHAGAWRGSRRCAGPTWKPALRVDPGDRSAAGTNLHDVQHNRRADRKPLVVTADIIGRLNFKPAILDQGALGRRAAHIEELLDQAWLFECAGIYSRPDATADRTGLDQSAIGWRCKCPDRADIRPPFDPIM